MALFRKRKRVADLTPETLLVSLFDPDAIAAHEAGRPARFTVRAASSEDAFPGTSASVAYAGSNAPIAACVAGSALVSRSSSWLTDGLFASAANPVWVETGVEGPFRDAFRWLVMEMTPWALLSPDGRIQAMAWICDAIMDELKARAETDNLRRGKRRDNAATSATSAPTAEGSPVATGETALSGAYRAERPRDLPALAAYCAQQFMAGERRYSTVPSAFGFRAAGKDIAGAPDDPAWFRGSFECLAPDGKDAKAFSFLYAFSRSALPHDPDALSPFLDGLAAGLFAESARRFLALAGLKPGKSAVNRLNAAPDFARAADLFFIDFLVRDSNLSIPARVVAPIASLMPLARAWNLPLSRIPDAADGASALFGVNARMLAKVLPSIIESPELRPRVPRFCVSELLRLLSDRDARLVIQNVLIPDYGAKRLPELVFQAVTVTGADGRERQALIPYGPFDPARFDSFLPDAFKRGFYEQTRALSIASAESCAELNDEALRAVMRAALGGRIGATERLKYLMRELVLKPDTARAETAMAELRERGVPFGTLRGLDPKAAQRVAAAVDDRDFALALVDCPEELSGMRKYASRGKTERLREDLTFVRRLIKDGSLTLSDALHAKEKIRLAIERDAERERERAELEARTPAVAPPTAGVTPRGKGSPTRRQPRR